MFRGILNDRLELFIKLIIILNRLPLSMQSELTGVAPKIEQHPNSIVVNVTDPVTLECRATGHPKPDITWYKDGKSLHVSKILQRFGGVC